MFGHFSHHLETKFVSVVHLFAGHQHVHKLDAGHRLQQFDSEVIGRSNACGRVVDRARLMFGESDRILDAVRREVGVHHHNIRRRGDKCDRLKSLIES